jgi:hypothetical protein
MVMGAERYRELASADVIVVESQQVVYGASAAWLQKGLQRKLQVY